MSRYLLEDYAAYGLSMRCCGAVCYFCGRYIPAHAAEPTAAEGLAGHHKPDHWYLITSPVG